jgi:hypothetical protein
MNGKELCRKRQALKQLHDIHLTRWDELSRYFLPEHGEQGTRDAASSGTERDKPLTGEGFIARGLFSAGIFSMTYQEGSEWFSLRDDNEELMDSDVVSTFLTGGSKKLLREFQKSNFSQAYQENVDHYSTFGHGVMYYERTNGKFFFKNYSIVDVALDYDDQGTLTTACRDVTFSAYEAVELFGEDKVSEKIKEAAKDPATMYVRHKFFHLVCPRKSRDVTAKDAKNMRFASYWVETESENVCEESGFNVFPYVAPRYNVFGGDIYGRGPGDECLPDIRQLNKLCADFNYASEMAAGPPIFTDDDEVLSETTLKPRRVIPVSNRRGGEGPVSDRLMLYEVGNTLPVLASVVERQEGKVRAHFRTDLFLSQQQDTQKTAAEIYAKEEERLQAIVPVISRQGRELFNPLIVGCFQLYLEDPNSGLGPLPQNLKVEKLNPQYVSRLGQRLGMVQNQNFLDAMQQMLALLGATAQVPELEYIIDVEKACRQIARNSNVDPEMLLTEVEALDLRAKKQAAEGAMLQAQAQLAEQQATTKPIDPMKRPESGSPAERMLRSA